jgi:hypothetical protein
MKKLSAALGIFLFFICLSFAYAEEYPSQYHRLDVIDLLGMQIFSIPQIAPKPTNGDDMQRTWYNDIEDGTYIDFSDTDEMAMVAPVYLPHGAIIKKFALLAVHDFSGESIEAYLVRHDPFTNTAIPLAETDTIGLSTSGSVQVVLDETISESQVKNTKYDYFVLVIFSRGGGTDLAFRGARIVYE